MLTEPFGVAAAARGHGDADALAFPFASCRTVCSTALSMCTNRGILPSGGCYCLAGNAGAEHLIEPVYRILHAVRAAYDADAGIRLIRGIARRWSPCRTGRHTRRPGQRLFSHRLRRFAGIRNLLSDHSVLRVTTRIERAVLRECGGLSRSNIRNYRRIALPPCAWSADRCRGWSNRRR